MQKNLRYKFLFILKPGSASGMFSRINLGLDLKGGMHLVLQVVTADALNQELSQDAERIGNDLRDKKLVFESSKKGNGLSVEIKGIDPSQDRDVRNYLTPFCAGKYNISGSLANGKTDFVLTMMPSVVRSMQESTVEQALATIERRVNALGVTEPSLQIYGSGGSQVADEIIVELPGIDDYDRVKDLIQDTAQLTLCMVKKDNGGPFPTLEAAVQANGGKIPDGYQILSFHGDRGDPNTEQYLVINAVPTITGKDLKNARRGSDNNGRPDVDFFLTAAGAQLFGRATEQHIGDRLAIVMDGQVSSAPVIQGRIDERGQITGGFSVQEAEDLAMLLKTGALPASLIIAERE
jgi:preprotein translocase subunit SecD